MASSIFDSSRLFPSVLTVSTGIFSGMSIAINGICVPAALASSDPLPAWARTYKNGSKIALSCIGTSVLTSVGCYLNSENDTRYLMVAVMSGSVAIYTLLFIKPINDSLFAIRDEEKPRMDTTIRSSIRQWNSWQWGRTALSSAAFLTTVWITFSK